MPLAHSTIGELITQIKDYRPSDLLPVVKRCSDQVRAAPGPGLRIQLPKNLTYGGIDQEILVAQYLLALIARLSLINSHEFATGTLNEERFLRILRTGCDLYDPATADDPWRDFRRTIYEQAPFQESIWQMIPRALLMYEEANEIARVGAVHDIGADFEAEFALTIREYLTLGFALYAQFTSDPVFFPLGGWHPSTPILKELLTTEKKEALLRLVCADAKKFKETNDVLALSNTKAERYDFNSLFMYPVIDLGSGKCVSPIPDLLALRLYDAPYYELANLNEGSGKGNTFRTFFGNVFQEYVGVLLREALVAEKIESEIGPNPPGPVDWAVSNGNCGLLIECRASELSLRTRYSGDDDAIQSDLDNIVVKTVERLAAKRDAIGAQGWMAEDVEHVHLLMVVKEPLLPAPYLRGLIDAKLSKSIPYHLLAIDELEQLLALEKTQAVCGVLTEKESSAAMKDDFRSFFASKRDEYTFRKNPSIERAYDQYFADLGVDPPKE
jgi:hypothetical protein